jgi:hypothetical protein
MNETNIQILINVTKKIIMNMIAVVFFAHSIITPASKVNKERIISKEIQRRFQNMFLVFGF